MICSPRPVDSGRFISCLVVCKDVWPNRLRVIAVRRGDYGTEDVAIDAARTQGVEWVENFGQADTPGERLRAGTEPS